MDPGAAAAVPWCSYSQYISLDAEGNIVEVAHDNAVPLADHIRNTFVMDLVGMSSKRAGLLDLPGETDPLKLHLVPTDEGKKIARTILKAIWRNQLLDVCFSAFNAENVVVSPTGRVRFRNVTIRRGLAPQELAVETRSNYVSARTIIADVLYSGSPPPEIRHLLHLIDLNVARELYHVHASLLPIIAHPGFYKEMYELVRHVLPSRDLKAFLNLLPNSYIDSSTVQNVSLLKWQHEVYNNVLLEQTFLYKGSKCYQVPANKPRQTCLNNDQKAAIRDLGETQDPHQSSLHGYQIRMIKWIQFLDFLRNRSAHRMDNYRSWWTASGDQFNSVGAERIVHIRFPLILSELQHALFALRRHDRIDMESFF